MLTLYCIVALLANVLAIVFLRDYLNFTVTSTVPAVTMVLSVFEAVYVHHHRALDEKNTAYSTQNTLNTEEWARMMPYMRNAFVVTLPLYISLICFFSSWVKTIGSLVLFVLGFLGGALAFKIKHKSELSARIDKDERELEEQKRREELGQWK